ncbi:hypothetical protein SDC9_00365 [bioreactor metagenome]|uniref:Baseplate protein J-like domain-containing protein n=1 Tax=bioreactor metagenome TaxID=1076179 RepID=A0A644SJQ4_9ZZZZ
MARSVDTIYADLIAKKESDSNLDVLNSTSKTAIWRLWLYILAYATNVLESLFDKHYTEVTSIITELKPHTMRWYRQKALAFQYGFDLISDTDIFDNGTATEAQIEASKIIKYAAITEATTESRLVLKIATEDSAGKLAPITSGQESAFIPYIEEIKDAGVAITVINYLPDILKLNLRIYYDPLVLTSSGVSIRTGKKPVEEALNEFMKELPFNGELVLNSLIDKLQKTEGVKIPHLVQAASKWIDTALDDYGNFENISVKKIPVSGYFEIENFDNIEYVV